LYTGGSITDSINGRSILEIGFHSRAGPAKASVRKYSPHSAETVESLDIHDVHRAGAHDPRHHLKIGPAHPNFHNPQSPGLLSTQSLPALPPLDWLG